MSFRLFGPTDTIDLDNVRVKRPYEVNGCCTYDVLYDGLQIFMQTPECLIPFGHQLLDNGVFFDVALNDDVFIEALQDLIEYVRKRVDRCTPKIIEGKRFVSPMRDKVLRVRCQDLDDVMFFDSKNKKASVSDFRRGDRVVLIFHVENVFVYKDFYKVSTRLVQAKRLNVQITKCLFDATSHANEEEELLPGKYQKMLEMGVPRAAVEQRMKLDGLVKPTCSLPAARAVPEKTGGGHQPPSLDEIVGALKNLRQTKQIS